MTSFSTAGKKFRTRFAATLVAACVAMAPLTACASWDDAGTSAEVNAARDSLPDPANLPDPRELTGVTTVENIAQIVPITDDAQPALPVELTDSDGYDVTVTDTSRILALDLYGGFSKTLVGLGMADNIVGRTVSSTEEVLEDRPVVTHGGHNLNVEAILELRPTLVIVDHSIGPREAIDQIRDAGVTTVVMNPHRTIETVEQDIKDVAGVVGLPEEGEKLAARSLEHLQEDMTAAKSLAPADPMRMAFLYARGNGGIFFVLGPDSGTSDLIESLGGIDVAKEAGITDMTPANAESLAKLNPEVLIMMNHGLDSTGGVDGLLQRPGVAQTIAGQKQRIVTLPDGDALSFGPNTGEVLVRAAIALYSE